MSMNAGPDLSADRMPADMDEPITPRGQKIQPENQGLPPPPKKVDPKRAPVSSFLVI